MKSEMVDFIASNENQRLVINFAAGFRNSDTFFTRRGYVSLEPIDFDGTKGLQEKYFDKSLSELEFMQQISSDVLCSSSTQKKIESSHEVLRQAKNLVSEKGENVRIYL